MASTTAVNSAPGAAAAKPRARTLGGRGETFKAIALVVVPVVGFFIGMAWYDESYYKAEEGLGYWLGLVGGVLMLLGYLYSLRKHIPALQRLQKLSSWLKIHIAFGIVGPFLIIPHTTFKFESTNGTLAFIAMSLVFLSGVVGRYFYSKIHFDYSGKKATVRELTDAIGLYDKEQKSVLSAIAPVRDRLAEYEKLAMNQQYGVWPAIRTLWMVRIGGYTLYWSLARNMRSYLAPYAQAQGWSAQDVEVAATQVKQIVKRYIEALIMVAQFKAYDQLFVLWRIVHVPLLFLLFISGVLHVLYTHMY